jgi:hypothetical protein
MAGFTDTLRGDGLVRAQRALAGLQGDPLRLDRARQRFSHSPPPYTSNPSGTTTRSASPIPPSEERRRQRRDQLGWERMASEPYHQFEHQINDEKKRIMEADLDRTRRIPVGSDAYTIAYENVKKRWVEQGIWNSKWNQFASGRWKHEEPLEIESESETDSEAGPSPPLFSFIPKPQPKPRRPKSDDEKRRIAERRVVREREREASRPYHQFVYQISTERERIQEESRSREGADTVDINTRAYENVKNTWTKRGIWNKRWGILPGMSWKHEEPLEDEGADGPIPVSETATRNAQPPVSNGAGQAPFPPLFGPLPQVEPDHLQGPRDEEPLRFLPDPNSFFHSRNAQPPADHEAGKAPFARDPPLFGPHLPLFGPRPPVEPNQPHGSRGPKPLLQRSIGKYGGFYDGDLREEMIANGDVPADFFTKRIRPSIGDDRPSEDGPNFADADADEEPLEETADGPAPVPANPLVNGSHEAGEAPAIRIFGSPPAESNHRQASGALNSSQQGPPTDIDSAGLENGDAERSSSTSNSPPPSSGKRLLRPTTGQALLPSKRKASHKDGQPANASLGPVHSSKVSKAAGKRKGPQRRLNISQKVSSDGLPLSSGVDAAEPQPSPPPDRVTPRRSKRIQPPVSSAAKDPAKTASTVPSKRAVRLKPERKVASNLTTRSSAKPQGVSKRQPAKTTRGKARKK